MDTGIRVWAVLATLALILVVVGVVVMVPERGSAPITDNVVGGYFAERASASQENRAKALALQFGLRYPSGGLWVTEDPSFPYGGLYDRAQDAIVISPAIVEFYFDQAVAHEMGHSGTSYPMMLFLVLAPIMLLGLLVGNMLVVSNMLVKRRRLLLAVLLTAVVFIVLASLGILNAQEFPARYTEGLVTGSHMSFFQVGTFLSICVVFGAGIVVGWRSITKQKGAGSKRKTYYKLLAVVVVVLAVGVAASSLGVWDRRQSTMDDVLGLPNVMRITDYAGNPVAERDIRFYSLAENLGMAPPKGGIYWANLRSSSIGALGCYFPDIDVIVLDWSLSEDHWSQAGVTAEFYRTAAHELGHSNTSGWVWVASDLFNIGVVAAVILLSLLMFVCAVGGLFRPRNVEVIALAPFSIGMPWLYLSFFTSLSPLLEIAASVAEARAGYWAGLLFGVGITLSFLVMLICVAVFFRQHIERGLDNWRKVLSRF